MLGLSPAPRWSDVAPRMADAATPADSVLIASRLRIPGAPFTGYVVSSNRRSFRLSPTLSGRQTSCIRSMAPLSPCQRRLAPHEECIAHRQQPAVVPLHPAPARFLRSEADSVTVGPGIPIPAASAEGRFRASSAPRRQRPHPSTSKIRALCRVGDSPDPFGAVPRPLRPQADSLPQATHQAHRSPGWRSIASPSAHGNWLCVPNSRGNHDRGARDPHRLHRCSGEHTHGNGGRCRAA